LKLQKMASAIRSASIGKQSWGLSIDDVSMPVDSVGRNLPILSVYASIARLA
jgi:hypothetical protein